MEDEKYKFILRKGMKVIFDFENHRNIINESSCGILPGRRIEEGVAYYIGKIFSDSRASLLEFGELSFSSRFLIPACKTDGCNNPMFCVDGFCEECNRQNILIANR